MKYTINTVGIELDKSEMLLIHTALNVYASELVANGTYENEFVLQRLCRQFRAMNKAELEKAGMVYDND